MRSSGPPVVEGLCMAQSFSNIDANLYIFVFSRVLNSTMFESWAIVGPYPSWWLFNFLLLVLQVLHIIWAYLIARIAIKAMLRGKVSPRTDRVGGGGGGGGSGGGGGGSVGWVLAFQLYLLRKLSGLKFHQGSCQTWVSPLCKYLN